MRDADHHYFVKAKFRFASLALLSVGCLAVSHRATAAEPTWKAGVARVNITPTESIWMAGYGARTKPSEGVRQPLYAKALALEDHTGAVSVIVTADLIGFRREPAERIVARAAKEHNLARQKLILNASHTHSGPMTRVTKSYSLRLGREQIEAIQRYQDRLVDLVVDLIGQVLARREPVTLAYEQGLAGFAVNRRRVQRREHPSPTDHDVPVLAVRKADGSLLAAAFGYACHATVLNDYRIDGDWPGYAQSALEERYPGAMALFVNGCGADQNPLPRRKVELAKRYGDTLAIAVDLVLKGEMRDLSGPLRTAFERVPLAFKAPSRAEFEARLNDGNQRKRNHAKRMLTILEEGELIESMPYPVQVWQFGDALTLIALAGEAVVDYSLRFKRAYGWHDTWVSAYNNDVFGYVPSLRVLTEGGYEGGDAMWGGSFPGPFRAGVEETIAETVDELVERTGGND